MNAKISHVSIFYNHLQKYFTHLIQKTMHLKWTDIQDIAIELYEKYPEIDPQYVSFTDLYNWVLELTDFDDDPKRCGEKILEAIQLAWIEERSECGHDGRGCT